MGEHAGTYATHIADGHGRGVRQIERVRVAGQMQQRLLENEYLPTGEVTRVVQRVAGSATPDAVRWMKYDSQGRMVLNVEPNTSSGFDPDPSTDPDTLEAWRYRYNDSGQMVGMSDARGCGSNYHYDSGGRLVAEDRSPCLDHHAPYSAPDLATGDGTEMFYRYDTADPDTGSIADAAGQPFDIDTSLLHGRLASVSALGSKGVYNYDARGQVRGTAVRIAAPGTPATDLSARYTPRWYTQYADFDAPGRPVRATTGVTLPALMGPGGTSEVTTTYTKRGATDVVSSSYGTLVAGSTLRADGKTTSRTLGDAASTTRSYGYDINRRMDLVFTQRNSSGPWLSDPGYTPPAPGEDPTLQELLEHYSFDYDVVGNIIGIEDGRVATHWPDTAKPVTRRFEYDDRYRLTRATYEYAGGADLWKSPYDHENQNPEEEVQPSPHVDFDTRVTEQTFGYDRLGNFTETHDDQEGFFDRSLGTITSGTPDQGPHQLQSASNRATGSPRQGDLDVAYDDAGNMTGMVVRRDGPCLPAGASCWQRFDYQWDEVGQLSRARRWDLTVSPDERTDYASLSAPVPLRTPDAELHYRYSGGERVLKTAYDENGTSRHTVYIFGSLELRSADFVSGDYQHDTTTVELRLPGARVVYAQEDLPGAQSGGLHLFHELADSVGSTTFVIDHETGELVEYATYLAYGAPESDYRPERWEGFREPYRFSGKEDDIEVGLSYFGARYYSAYLGVWMSPDPVTIHDLGSDTNPYAYVRGTPLMGVDPDGREPISLLGAAIVVASAAAIAATTSTVVQAANNNWDFSKVDWGQVGISAAVGAVSAGVTLGIGSALAPALSALGTVGSQAVGGAIGGAAAGAASYAVSTGLSGGSFSLEGLGKSMGLGALGGATGGATGGALQDAGRAVQALAGSASSTTANAGVSAAFGGEFSGEDFALSLGVGLAGSLASHGAGELAREAGEVREQLASASPTARQGRGQYHNGVLRDRIDPNEPITDPVVKAEMWQAWHNSRPHTSNPREWGGITWKSGKLLHTKLFPGESRDQVNMNEEIGKLPKSTQQKTVSTFHTHPNESGPNYGSAPSPADKQMMESVLSKAALRNNPHYVIAHDGVYRMTLNNGRATVRYLGTKNEVLQ